MTSRTSTAIDRASAAPAAPLARALVIQSRVVRALLMRELITRFGRRNLGVAWLVIEPMLFTLGVAALWTFAGLHTRSSLPIVAFAVTGYSSVLLWRNTVTHNMHAIHQNRNLLFHRHVRLLDVFAARVLLETGGATASFGVLTLFFASIGWMPLPEDPLLMLAGWLLLGWFGASLALLLGAATAFSEVLARLWHPVSYLLFPLSGAAFMVDWLPAPAQEAVLWLPMIHGVEMIREGCFGAVVHTHHDATWLLFVNLGLSVAGLLALRLAARRVENA